MTDGDRQPEYVLVIRWGARGEGHGEFGEPHGICLDTDRNLLVTDSRNNRVYRFTRAGELIGELNAGPDGFHGPRDVCVDAHGNIYVVDGTSGRISRFSPSGEVTAQWGERGSGPGQFRRPHALAVGSNGHLYAADVDNCRVQVYDSSGKFLFQWGERGSGPGQFMAPHGICADHHGDIIVCEYDGRRCQKFAPDGTHRMTLAVLPPDGPAGYHAMACDHDGNLYLALRGQASADQAVAKCSNRGESIASLAPPADPTRTFMPNCAAIDADDRVYVTAKGRGGVGVYVFAPDGAS